MFSKQRTELIAGNRQTGPKRQSPHKAESSGEGRGGEVTFCRPRQVMCTLCFFGEETESAQFTPDCEVQHKHVHTRACTGNEAWRAEPPPRPRGPLITLFQTISSPTMDRRFHTVLVGSVNAELRPPAKYDCVYFLCTATVAQSGS